MALTAVLRPAATFLVIVAWAMPDGPVGAETVSACSSQLRKAGGIEVDLAPPGTYVDLCREDLELCRTLTAGYPPSVTTLAYFVPADDWATFQKTRQGFREYLIAQLGSERVDELPRLKESFVLRAETFSTTPSFRESLPIEGEYPSGLSRNPPIQSRWGFC